MSYLGRLCHRLPTAHATCSVLWGPKSERGTASPMEVWTPWNSTRHSDNPSPPSTSLAGFLLPDLVCRKDKGN